MGVKNILFGLVLIMLINIVCAVPIPDYTLYGKVTVDGTILTKDDSNIISLTVDGKELTSFTMGEVDADAYVLRVPMNSEEIEGFAQVGDTARIYIDGKEADQSPVTIGDFGTTVNLDLTIGSEQGEEEESSGRDSSSGGSSRSSDREPEHESITITVSDEEEPIKEEVKEDKKAIVTKTEDKKVEEKSEKITEEQKIDVFQRLINFLGFGEKATTGAAVAEVPRAKPLIGILIALVIIAIGLAIAYFVIFKREEY